MNVLVAGGARYIELPVSQALESAGFNPLGRGSIESELARIPDCNTLLHLGIIQTPRDSMTDPRTSFRALAHALSRIDEVTAGGIRRIVLLSNCSVYGEPVSVPVDESVPRIAINPFGEATIALEECIESYTRALGLQSIILRVFNVGGVDEPDDHLIPAALAVARGEKELLEIFGEGSEGGTTSHDGSCVRDFVHVDDVADAGVLALKMTESLKPGQCEVFNVGFGAGYSVLEVVEMARQVTGKPILTEGEARKAGEPGVVISAPDKIMRDLGWQPRRSELDRIIASAARE